MKRWIKGLIPVFLAVVIVVGGYYGIYGMKFFIKDDLNEVKAFEKDQGGQLFYLGDQEQPLIYPWSLYESDECVSVTSQSTAEYKTDPSYFSENVKRYLESVGSGLGKISLEEMSESFVYSPKNDIYYLKDYKCKEDGQEYFLNMAVTDMSGRMEILYYHYQPVQEQKTDKEAVLAEDQNIKDALKDLKDDVYFSLGMDLGSYENPYPASEVEADENNLFNIKHNLILTAGQFSGKGNLFWDYFGQVMDADALYKTIVLMLIGSCSTLSYNNEIMIIFTLDQKLDGMAITKNLANTLIFFYDVPSKKIIGFSTQYQ